MKKQRGVQCFGIGGGLKVRAQTSIRMVLGASRHRLVRKALVESVLLAVTGRIALFGNHKPADVVLGVTTLSPGYLIEVGAIAIID